MAKDYRNIYVNTLLACHLLLSLNDELKHTDKYRQVLKARVNGLTDELTKVCNSDLSDLWGVEDNTLYEIMEKQEQIMKEVAKINSADYDEFLGYIKEFKNKL